MEHTNITAKRKTHSCPLQYPTAPDLLRDDLKIMTEVEKNYSWLNQRISSPDLPFHNQP